jgi:hypothetical protein
MNARSLLLATCLLGAAACAPRRDTVDNTTTSPPTTTTTPDTSMSRMPDTTGMSRDTMRRGDSTRSTSPSGTTTPRP